MLQIYCGEPYVASAIRVPPDAGIVSLYGSADAGLMGFENTSTIAMRRLAATDADLRQRVFASSRLPMLFQYLPTHRFFESVAGELCITADRTIPLVRYNLHDEGSVIPNETLHDVMKPATEHEHQLPLVFVFGRGTFAATLYGANIFAEDVQGLFQAPSLAGSLTGRFVMATDYDDQQAQQLTLHVELSRDEAETSEIAGELRRSFVQHVADTCSEYRRILAEYGESAHPRVKLHSYGARPYFSPDRQIKGS